MRCTRVKVFVSLTVFTAFLFCVCVYGTTACTLAGKSLSKFDDREYVFIGQVVGFTDPAAFDDPRSSASLRSDTTKKTIGLRVRMTEEVSVPKIPTEFFEIYLYDLWADCSISGATLETVRTQFPIGSEVRVISREAILLTEPAKAGIVRLENQPGELGSVALNKDSAAARMSTAKSVFDYKAFRYDMNVDSDSKYLLPSFEIRKDLFRLKTSNSPAERRAVLNRVLYLPSGADVDLKAVFDGYAENQAEADRLFDSYLMMSDSEIYAQYKILRKVTAELLRLGFQKSEADAALRKAIESGTDIEYDELMKKTLNILRSPK
jgi:hypothetical protein